MRLFLRADGKSSMFDKFVVFKRDALKSNLPIAKSTGWRWTSESLKSLQLRYVFLQVISSPFSLTDKQISSTLPYYIVENTTIIPKGMDKLQGNCKKMFLLTITETISWHGWMEIRSPLTCTSKIGIEVRKVRFRFLWNTPNRGSGFIYYTETRI